MADERLVEDLLALWRLLRRASSPVRRAESTPEQYWLLTTLHRQGALPVGELAAALGITGSSATTACKRLERAGLVRRERQRSDERVVRVALTAAGAERVASWQRERREALARLLAPLDDAEREQLQRLVERVLAEAGAPAAGADGVVRP
ncbi:MAG TPA: MarR family transcriptional regulator [Thermomicrobiales bacterium]|nr:MarR family transcriptional regulator [Thermomicrobiales bacterium]